MIYRELVECGMGRGFGDFDDEDIFIWDDENIEHIGHHNVEPFEAEEAMTDDFRVKFQANDDKLGIIGATEDGRRLVVIFVKKVGNKYRVITARIAEPTEKKLYNKRRGNK